MTSTLNPRPSVVTTRSRARVKATTHRDRRQAGEWTLADARAEELARSLDVSIRRAYQLKDGEGLVGAFAEQFCAAPRASKAGLLAWGLERLAAQMIADAGGDVESLYRALNRRETRRQGELDALQMEIQTGGSNKALVGRARELKRGHIIALVLLYACGDALEAGS